MDLRDAIAQVLRRLLLRSRQHARRRSASPTFLAPFGFGSLTGIDISGEKPGLLPSQEWKRKAFARPADQVWFPGETVNFGIGQGYFLVTPLQLAHYTSILANRGKSYKPRLVTGVRDPAHGR